VTATASGEKVACAAAQSALARTSARQIVELEQVGFLRRAPDGRLVRRAVGRAGREISEPADVFVPPAVGSFSLGDQFAD
jgi:hypothetical protein